MQFSVKSNGNFLRQITRIRTEFSKPISFRIVVPPDLRYWYWHEFGTATYTGGAPYQIKPVNADYLMWPDPSSPDGFHRQYMVTAHPGVRPRHMVRKVLDDIGRYTMREVMEALVHGGYKVSALRARLLEVSMPHVKSIIVQSIAQELPGSRTDGRLEGRTAAQDFEVRSSVKDMN